MRGLRDSVVTDVSVTEATLERTSDPIFLVGVIKMFLGNIFMRGIRYGINVSVGCRDIRIVGVEAEHVRHAVVPNSWADGIYVTDLKGTDCTAVMDAHPSFNVHYENVRATRETDSSNLRSVGGSVKNSHFSSQGSGTSYFQSLALVEPQIYDEYEFILENVVWEMPNAKNIWGGLNCGWGHEFTVRNVTAFALFVSNRIHTATIEDSTFGILVSRARNLKMQSTILDGDLNQNMGPGLVTFIHQGPVFIRDCVFRNADYVFDSDTGKNELREVQRTKFENIRKSFHNKFTYNGSYKYQFQNVELTNVNAIDTSVFPGLLPYSN